MISQDTTVDVDPSQRLHPLDLPHLGALYKRVREKRCEVPQAKIAEWAGVEKASLSHFEQEGASLTRNNRAVDSIDRLWKLEQRSEPSPDKLPSSFELCILALCLDQIDHDQEVTLPLEQADRDLLMSIYEEAGTLRQIKQHEQVYSSLDFQTLRESKSTPHLKPLWELEEALRKETRPAFIADSLWFMHALNGATFNLFGIVPPGLGLTTDHGKYLTRWEAWHVIGAKFTHESPVRAAHRHYNDYFPPTIDKFFRNLGPRLFTRQARVLIHRIIALSRDNNLDFVKAWKSSIGLSTAVKKEDLSRQLWFNDPTPPTKRKILHANAAEFKECEVRFQADDSFTETFWLGIWNGDDDESRRLINNLPGPVPNDKIFYPADFDVYNTFHVNTWPEVVEYFDQ